MVVSADEDAVPDGTATSCICEEKSTVESSMGASTRASPPVGLMTCRCPGSIRYQTTYSLISLLGRERKEWELGERGDSV